MTTINWICDFKAPSGYGRASRADLRALIKAGLRPNVTQHIHDRTQLKLEDPFWVEHEESVLAPAPDMPDITVWQETPEFYRPDPLTKDVSRIEWETSRIIDYDHSGNKLYNWVYQLNRMSEIWSASEFVAQALKDSGVTTPCYVIPHPTDLDMFCPGPRTIIGDNLNKDKFTVLSVFQKTVRKSPDELLVAWSRSSLGRKADCCLLLKTYGAGFGDDEARGIVSSIANFRNSLNIRGLKANVFPLTWLVPESRMPDLYRAADVYLNAARGEGFGMPQAEALACGIPAVYADNTAMRDYAVGYPVECIREPVWGMPHIPWYSADQDWWTPRISSMVEQLEKAYEDWKSGRLDELGKAARAKAEELHSDERVGALLKERIAVLIR